MNIFQVLYIFSKGFDTLSPGGVVEPRSLVTEELLKAKSFSERLVSTLLGSRKKDMPDILEDLEAL